MSKDQMIGLVLLVAGVFGIFLYGWLVFLTQWSMVVLQLTGFVAITAILAIVSWIGYTMATTPPLKPIEDVESELKEDEKASETTAQ
ncbi:MAG: transcriptional regulator [Candidatus Bathyarchaeia archaeon]